MNLPDYILKLLDNIAVQKKLLNYKFETPTCGSKKGDNFLGEMIAIKLVGTTELNSNLENITYHLLCKVPPPSKVRRDVEQTILAFEREVEMYSKVLPLFAEFQREKGLTNEDGFYNYPTVYVALCDKLTDQHVLIMDDLRFQNCRMFPREQRTDIEHATLAIETLAKFHAISFAIKDQRPQQFEQLKKKDVYLEMLKCGKFSPLFDETLDRSIRMLKNEEHKRMIISLRKNYMDVMEEFDELNGAYRIIAHGDFYNNNVMFQYDSIENFEKPVHVKFIDWQLSRCASPVFDIYYFLFTATDKSFRDKYYRTLLNSYHCALSTNISKLGSDSVKLYSFDELENDLKKYGRLALIYGIFISQFCFVDQQSVTDLEEYSKCMVNGEKCDMLLNLDNNEAMCRHINEIVGDIFDYGYMNE